MKTTIMLEHEPYGAGGASGGGDGGAAAHVVRALLRIEAEPRSDQARVPLNLSIVLDRSGSMAGAKLAAAREAAALLVRRLWPEDVVSVVAYAEGVMTIAPPATGAEQEGLPRRIEAIRSGGSTNLSGGWLRGRELVGQNLRKEGVNRVLLLTDGLANVGIVDPDALTGLCAAARREGITTTTIGFGADYDEHLLRAMADAGGGNTYYIERPDQAPGIFEEEIQGLLSLAAQNLAVTVMPAPAASVTAVHHDYRRAPAENGVRLELGDLYAREPRSLLLEFLVRTRPGPVPAEEAAVATVCVTGHVITSSGDVEHREIRLPITFSPAEGPRVNPEVRRELMLIRTARARQEALERRARGDFDGASTVLSEIAAALELGWVHDPELAEEAADLRAMARKFYLRDITVRDAKYLYQRSYDNLRSRVEAKKRILRNRTEDA